jgi:hypothetical protein
MHEMGSFPSPGGGIRVCFSRAAGFLPPGEGVVGANIKCRSLHCRVSAFYVALARVDAPLGN